jgi:hypothetical protein
MQSVVDKAPTVELCELLRDGEHYDQLVVRTNAVLFVDRENETLFSPSCDSGDNHAWVEFDPSYIYTNKNIRATLTELIRPKQEAPTRKAQVTVVGRFEGPNMGPYGHLDSYKYRFSIIRLENASAVR